MPRSFHTIHAWLHLHAQDMRMPKLRTDHLITGTSDISGHKFFGWKIECIFAHKTKTLDRIPIIHASANKSVLREYNICEIITPAFFWLTQRHLYLLEVYWLRTEVERWVQLVELLYQLSNSKLGILEQVGVSVNKNIHRNVFSIVSLIPIYLAIFLTPTNILFLSRFRTCWYEQIVSVFMRYF